MKLDKTDGPRSRRSGQGSAVLGRLCLSCPPESWSNAVCLDGQWDPGSPTRRDCVLLLSLPPPSQHSEHATRALSGDDLTRAPPGAYANALIGALNNPQLSRSVRIDPRYRRHVAPKALAYPTFDGREGRANGRTRTGVGVAEVYAQKHKL